MGKFAIGQRWLSTMEPELGIGTIIHFEDRNIVLKFNTSKTIRKYAFVNAPLKRVEFKPGDLITGKNNTEIIINEIETKEGLFIYHGIYQGKKVTIPENEVPDTISFDTPEKRLLNNHTDDLESFNMRYETLIINNKIKESPAHGFIGPKIDLIHHQFYIANEVSKRMIPRVLLSDEVGLGKTIEACLILHRLITTGRIKRILILLPHSLVNQWYIELIHKFKLVFEIYNEKICKNLEINSPDSNPFLDSQLVLCDIDFLYRNKKRKNQAFISRWDMIVIDEAHHIKYGTQMYDMINKMAKITDGLILLTATPEQLGEENHFHRLSLLDSSRFYDYDQFIKEQNNYKKIADLTNHIILNDQLTKDDMEFIKSLVKDREKIFDDNTKNTILEGNKDTIIKTLLDRYGTGRVIYRNTRNAIKNFSKKKLHIIDLKNQNTNQNLYIEAQIDLFNENAEYKLNDDIRINWLINFLKSHINEKVLLICCDKEKAKQIGKILNKKAPLIRFTSFHEDIDLLTRDRNSYYFQSENGAQLLICSEIGSEGRNFQFVNNLVLFDLPLNPDLLEQRIGRLDRIGQTKTINIYVPVIKNTHMEILARWHNEALNIFLKMINTGSMVYEKYGSEVKELCQSVYQNKNDYNQELNKLIKESYEYNQILQKKLEQGRDRILELHSYDKNKANHFVKKIKSIEKNTDLEHYFNKSLDYFGIRIKHLDNRSYYLTAGNIKTDAFPVIKSKGLKITYDREAALLRNDTEFITYDHPLVNRMIDLILGNENGNSSFGILNKPGEDEILLESIFIVECICPPELYVNRFLSYVPIRIIVNHKLQDVTINYPYEDISEIIKRGNPDTFLSKKQVTEELLPDMVMQVKMLAKNKSIEIIDNAIKKMTQELIYEVERLSDLQKYNKNINNSEILLLKEEINSLKDYISRSRLRMDALRLIWKTNH